MTGPDVAPTQSWANTEDVVNAIQAMPANTTLRVRGSGHSYPHESRLPNPGGVLAELDPTQKIGGLNTDGTITVWAGNHLGPDPRDPRLDPKAKALYLLPHLWTLDLALPDTGGITHQTVGGFMSTGSSGGTLTRPLESSITAIEIVDGSGNVSNLPRPGADADPLDSFFMVGVSLGLLGVITQVTFKPEPTFSVIGKEAITTTGDCAVDLFGSGNGTPLATFFQETDYARITWWPQQGVDRVAVWQSTSVVPGNVPEPKPYRELGYYFNTELFLDFLGKASPVVTGLVTGLINNRQLLLAQWEKTRPWLEDKVEPDLLRQIEAIVDEEIGAGLLQLLADLVSNQLSQQFLVCAYFTMLGHRTDAGSFAEAMFNAMFHNEEDFAQTWSPLVMNDLFINLDSQKSGPKKGKPQTFRDYAYLALPMDDQISDDLIPTEFTELWVPMSMANQVMQTLHDFYSAPGLGYTRTGTYACEIYAAAASDFWLSPSNGTDVLRIDLYYFRNSTTPPDQDFYPQFWNLLSQYNFRPHWGKYLPHASGPQGAGYLAKQYKMMPLFLKERAIRDPKNLFLNEYWKKHLGL